LDYIKSLGFLPNIDYGKNLVAADKQILGISILRVSMKLTKDLQFFELQERVQNDIYCFKWLMFCLKVMDPDSKILNPNVKFQNDQRLTGHLMGTDNNMFTLKYIYNKSYKSILEGSSTFTDVAKFITPSAASSGARKKKPNKPALFVRNKPVETLNMRMFCLANKKDLFLVKDFLDLNSVKTEDNLISQDFLLDEISSLKIISLISHLDIKINLIFFSAVKIETKSGSKRVYNILSVDSIFNSENESIIFVYKDSENKESKYSQLPEENEDAKIDMKLYQ